MDSCQEMEHTEYHRKKESAPSWDRVLLLVGIMLAEPCNDPNSVSNGACWSDSNIGKLGYDHQWFVWSDQKSTLEYSSNHVLMLLTMTDQVWLPRVQSIMTNNYDHCFAPRNSTPKDQRVEAVSAVWPINSPSMDYEWQLEPWVGWCTCRPPMRVWGGVRNQTDTSSRTYSPLVFLGWNNWRSHRVLGTSMRNSLYGVDIPGVLSRAVRNTPYY